MRNKIRKFFAWLLTMLMVFMVLAGCAVSGSSTGGGTYTAGTEITITADEKANGVSERVTAAETQQRKETSGNEALDEETSGEDAPDLDEHGAYTSKEEVALYLHMYGRLPENYITKKDAQNLGWDSKKGNLWDVAPGMSIGGSHFGNYERQLPEKKGRKYSECDIDYDGGYRGEKRLIYSNDGLIFYTEDHYETFEQLY